MNLREAYTQLRSKIPGGSSLASALESFIYFYRDTIIDDCRKDDDTDRLLFQWGGPYDWDDCFSINLTRQATIHDGNGEYVGTQQLLMNCRYETAPDGIEDGNLWFDGSDLDAFLNMILASDCVQAAVSLNMKSVDIEFTRV